MSTSPTRYDAPLSRSLDELMAEIEGHPVFRNPYFERLQRQKWTRDTYALHRANFFFRTELTVKIIAHLCARAADENDVPTLTLFSYILNEEAGNGALDNCHAVLLERSHNLFGHVVFGLDPLPIRAAKHSPLVLPSTARYREGIRELCSTSYQRMLGVAVALETHAEKMLTHCRSAFRAHAGCFERSEFVKQVEVYFNCHLSDGVEGRHAADARECVRRNCGNAEDLAEIACGARETLATQLLMWEDLTERTVAIENDHSV